MFSNRQEAGILLAEKLAEERPDLTSGSPNQNVVIGIGAGGILVARHVSTKLRTPLTAFSAESIKDYDNPEREIAAVTSSGLVLHDESIRTATGEHCYLGHQIRSLVDRAHESQRTLLAYPGIDHWPQMTCTKVIFVDEGMLSPLIGRVAAMTVNELGATELILATPAIEKSTKQLFETVFDAVIPLTISPGLVSMEHIYSDYQPADNPQMLETLYGEVPDGMLTSF